MVTRTEVEQLNKYFNLVNYMSVGQLYLLDNPLLKRPLELKDVKPRLVGHWGTVPGQNFILMHCNRVITKYDLDMMYIIGPGHGGEAEVTNAYIDGTYQEVYEGFEQNEEGLKHLFKQFSFPGGVSSHVSPECPGSIHEGGELGYSLVHSFGAVLDNPNLTCTCVVGDGEAETGPLATGWNIGKFINPITDGVVLPILHLNGFKISNPTVLGRMSDKDLDDFFKGHGWIPYFVEGDDINQMNEDMANIMDKVITEIKVLKNKAIETNELTNFKWPMIILRTPKGWTGPKSAEGSFKAHQIPLAVDKDNINNLSVLESWMKSYHPEELFNSDGSIKEDIITFIPKGNRRMSARPETNGGKILKELILPDIKDYMIEDNHGKVEASDMMELGKYLRDVVKLNEFNRNFRIFGPDEALSNRLNHVFEVTDRQWLSTINKDTDEHLNTYGRVLDAYLSEHFGEGALESYLLTGRHGIFVSYEAFARVIDSMVSQFGKWLKMCNDLEWREPISALNIILTSHCWQQDHNGYTHQEPGFINHVLNRKRDMVDVYLPYDANSLIYIMNKCLQDKNKINTIIASKHPRLQWLNYDETINHCQNGLGIFEFASDENPDVVLGCAGDTPTLEVLAASKMLRETGVKVRVVNVVDLLKLENMSEDGYNDLFTTDKPVVFSFHGYPNVIEELIYTRSHRFDVIHGYEEEGTITTPFDMRVLNKIDRFNIILDALRLIDNYNDKTLKLRDYCEDALKRHREKILFDGQELDEVLNFKFN